MVLGSYHMALPFIHTLVSPDPGRLPEGAIVFSPNYRLAPAHPAPAQTDDCFAIWLYMVDHAEELGIDKERMVIAGESAGGGLAALLAQRITDHAKLTKGHPRPVLQLLIYPMLDDRTTARIDKERAEGRYQTRYPTWDPESNRFGWASYLGKKKPNGDVVPARREDLAGLPPAWIGVGSLDLFHEEDVEYARRLKEAGVDVVLEVVNGGFHGFDALKGKDVVKAFKASQILSLRKALGYA